MRLATIRDGGTTRAVRVEGDSAIDLGVSDVGELLRSAAWRDEAASATGASRPAADLDFAPLIPRPEKIAAKEFGAAAKEVFDRIIRMTDNAGATDEHRAVNYLAVRYPAIYAKAAEAYARDFSLTGLEVRPSPLTGARKLADVIFCHTNRNTDFAEKCFVRVDVTEEFPFLATKLAPWYDH